MPRAKADLAVSIYNNSFSKKFSKKKLGGQIIGQSISEFHDTFFMQASESSEHGTKHLNVRI